MKKILYALLIGLAVTTGLQAQKTVLGTVDYSYEIVGEGAEQLASMMPTKMVVKYGKNGLSMKSEGGMMSSAMGNSVVNGKTEEVFMISHKDKTIYLMNNEDIQKQAESASKPEVQESGETMVIMGYKCRKQIQTITAQGQPITQVMWVTDKLRAPKYDSKLFAGMAGQSGIGFDMDGFPLMVEINLPGMPVEVKLKATNIVFEDIPASEFEKPQGYEEKSFEEMKMF